MDDDDEEQWKTALVGPIVSVFSIGEFLRAKDEDT